MPWGKKVWLCETNSIASTDYKLNKKCISEKKAQVYWKSYSYYLATYITINMWGDMILSILIYIIDIKCITQKLIHKNLFKEKFV